MGRKLATIQKINELTSIKDADKIEVASVLGWKVVVRKGEFKVGDLVVYCEIDSILPDKPEFEFLKDRKFRIRTIRLRGQISQGICFPLNILSDTLETGVYSVEEGTDVTEILGIKKHMPQIPANLSGVVKGTFPSFIPKTDETRVQVLQAVLTRHKGKTCYITEKVDGTSVTYYIKDGEFGVCSRNMDLKETKDNLYWKMARELEIEEKLKSLGKNISIQGELIGPGIQKNNLKIEEKKVLFFNVFDIDPYKYLDFEKFVSTISELGLETVSILETNFTLIDNIEALVELSKGTSKLNEMVFREGIVIRPLIEEHDMQMSSEFGHGRLTFKAINPEYLLKYE